MIFLKVLIICLFIHLQYSYTLINPISTCHLGCRSCDIKHMNICSSNLQQPCYQQFQLVNKQCVLDNKQFEKYQMSSQGLQQSCSYTSVDYIKNTILVPSVFKQEQGYQMNFAINQKQKDVAIYFEIFINQWTPFNDFLDILVESGSTTLFQGQISLQARPNINKQFAINCMGILMTTRQYKITLTAQKISKLNFVNNNANIHIIFQGYMALGKWAISNLQIVHPKMPVNQPQNKQNTIPDNKNEIAPEQKEPIINQESPVVKQQMTKAIQAPTEQLNQTEQIPKKQQIQGAQIPQQENKQVSLTDQQPKNLLSANYSQEQKQTQEVDIVKPFLITTETPSNLFKIELLSMYHLQSRNKSLRIKIYDHDNILNEQNLKIGIHGLNPYEQQTILIDMTKKSRVYDIYPTENFQREIIDLILVPKQEVLFTETTMKIINQPSQKQKIVSYKNNTSDTDTIVQSIPINRYDLIEQNVIAALIPIRMYFQILLLTSLGLIILSVLFRRGYLFEELILSLQLIFLHVFIFSPYMPYTFKIPLSGLFESITLNYLPQSIHLDLEKFIIGDIIQQSPLKYTQFERDINFTRAFIPSILICIFFAFWILIMKIIHFILQAILLKRSIINSHSLIGRFFIFLSKVGNRKMGFCYQVLRFMSLTIFWCTFVQLHNLNYPQNSSQTAVPNTIICMFFFILAISWPFAIEFYLKDQKNPNVRLDTLKDTMFLKNDPQNKYQAYYPFLTQLKYFVYALFIAYGGDIPLLVAIPLIIVQVGQIVYVIYNDIFSNNFYLALRIFQNLLFVGLKVIIMFMYGFSSYLSNSQYMKIGYVGLGFAVIISFNSIIRCCFLIFKKIAGSVSQPQGQYKRDMIGDFQPALGTERIF